VASLGTLALVYMAVASAWRRDPPPLVGQLYGLRDGFLFLALFFVGRGTPELGDDDRALRRLFTVCAVTCVLAILEQMFVSPELLVLAGVALYFNEFLNVGVFTASNEYGLPDNYWTQVGSAFVRRSGSVYLSSQGFAAPFLVMMPAATAWLLSARRRPLAWLAYALLWIGLLSSITRMTFLACVVQAAVVALVLRRPRFVWALAGAGAAAATVAMVGVPGVAGFVWDSLTWQHPSGGSHTKDYQKGFAALWERPLGSGLGTTDQAAVRANIEPLTADNQYLRYAVEIGGPGLLLVLAVLAGIGAAGARLAARGRTAPQRAFGVVVLATTVGIAVNGITGVVFNSFVVSYLYFWMAGATVTLLQRADAAEAA
jgi:hypothetical protein